MQNFNQLGPGREGAAVEEGFGGPFAEVDGERDAVAVVAGEDHDVFVARMAAEDGAHFFGNKNRAAPAGRDAHGGKGGAQMAGAAFETAETANSFGPAKMIVVLILVAALSQARGEVSINMRARVG